MVGVIKLNTCIKWVSGSYTEITELTKQVYNVQNSKLLLSADTDKQFDTEIVNKVTLLYDVETNRRKQYQAISTLKTLVPGTTI